MVAGRALLSDFSDKGLYLYVADRLPPNLEVVFEIDHPTHFKLVGKVIWCQYQPTSNKIIAAEPFPYRIGLGFHHATAETAKVFSEFCAQMTERYQSQRSLFEGQPTIQLETSGPTPEAAPQVTPLHAVPHDTSMSVDPDVAAEAALNEATTAETPTTEDSAKAA
ncbi:MAG: hypothetical protein EOP09_13070 [Proteobacteria bacterium]|nr:MAG: hypothetical protein EOP09_13070 [Pseudomonadota bacterium]